MRDDIQERADNVGEHFPMSEKAEKLQEEADQLDTAVDNIQMAIDSINELEI